MVVTFFCSSSEQLSPVFYSEAEQIGEALSEYSLLYGGSNLGMMGAVAKGCLKNNGNISGVITEGLQTDTNQQAGLTELIVTKDLNARKKLLMERADVFLVLPGGFGTLDEALDVLAAKQVGESAKPIIFYNCYGFWDGFFELSAQLFEQRMVTQELASLYTVVSDIKGLKETFKALP